MVVRSTFTFKGEKFSGCLSQPESGPGPGVLVLHAWWGLNAFISGYCDRLAGAGFTALAPDCYAGQKAATIEEAIVLRGKMDRPAAIRTMRLSADFLAGHPEIAQPRLGALGFSLGCSLAIEAARSKNRSVRAVVLYYGTGGGKLDKAQAAFLGHFAEDDRWGAHAKKATALADRIRTAGHPAEFFEYAGTEHWFAEDDRPEYRKEAAELAWGRSLEFLKRELA